MMTEWDYLKKLNPELADIIQARKQNQKAWRRMNKDKLSEYHKKRYEQMKRQNELTITNLDNPTWLQRRSENFKQMMFPITAYFSVIDDIAKRRNKLYTYATWKNPNNAVLQLVLLYQRTNNKHLRRIALADIKWLEEKFYLEPRSLYLIPGYYTNQRAKHRRDALKRYIKHTGNDKNAARRAIDLLEKLPNDITRTDINWIRWLVR